MNGSLLFLGLRRDCDVKERDATTAHRKLARMHHPDNNDFLLTGLNELQPEAFFSDSK